MKTIIEYQCEVCDKRYKNSNQAEACEAQGPFEIERFPVGLLYPVFWQEDSYVGIFGFGRVITYDHNQHLGDISLLAFRAPRYSKSGDSTFEDGLCGGELVRSFNQFFGIGDTNWRGRRMLPEYLEYPEFKRGVNYLLNKKIIPCYVQDDGTVIQVTEPI